MFETLNVNLTRRKESESKRKQQGFVVAFIDYWNS